MTVDEISAVKDRARANAASESPELRLAGLDTLAVLEELSECGSAYLAARRRAEAAEELVEAARRQRRRVDRN
jgi:hypothetical protein